MSTIEAKAPAELGLSINVISGPRGEVRDNNWPCIAFTVELLDSRRRVVWTGPYYLGIGHVKPLPYGRFMPGLTPDDKNCSHHWARGAVFKKTSEAMALQASTAAKLAQHQKVSPKLEDLVHSLVMDGSAFFDGLRFEDWAGELGYSSDSIKAKETFEACDRIGRDLARGLSRDDLASLREWASNY